jgi:hypothetical protein
MKPFKYLIALVVAISLSNFPNRATAVSNYCSNDSNGNEFCVVYSTLNKNQFNFLVITKYQVPVKNFGANRGRVPAKSSSYSANFSCSPPKTTVTQVRLKDALGRPNQLKTGTDSNLKFIFKSLAESVTHEICDKLLHG